jgi:hypothetical protein
MNIRIFLQIGLWLANIVWTTLAVHAQEIERNSPQQFLAHLAAANSALRLNEVTEARRWLDEIPQADRGWEWQLLNAKSDSSIQRISTGDWTPIRLDLSADGGQLAVACTSENLGSKFWRLAANDDRLYSANI